MIGHLAPVAITAIACALLGWFWVELAVLRGSFLWELRYLVFAGAVFLALSLAQWLARVLPRQEG